MAIVTQDEALAFANEAFRNMDVELNGDDLADIANALSTFAKATQKNANSALKGLLDEVSSTPAIDSEASGRAFAVLTDAPMVRSAPSHPAEAMQIDHDAADAWRREWRDCRGEHAALVEAFAAHRVATTVGQVNAVQALGVALKRASERLEIAAAKLPLGSQDQQIVEAWADLARAARPATGDTDVR